MDAKTSDQNESVPAFQRMPVELLTMIVEEIAVETADIWKILNVFPELKNLRLASRQFTYLPRIMSELFQSIRLTASREHLTVAETSDLSRLRPYVKRILFEPSKYSWTMTPQLFEEIILIPAMREACNKYNDNLRETKKNISHDEWLSEEQISRLGTSGFIKKYMDGKSPFSEQELKDGYAKYMASAQETRTLFENGAFRRAWTNILEHVLDVKEYRLDEWEYNGELVTKFKYDQKGCPWTVRGCEIVGHWHGHGHDHKLCQNIQGPVGEAVFKAAIDALAAAQTTITTLEIGNTTDGNFNWATNTRVKKLNLKELKKLRFYPKLAATSARGYGKIDERCHAVLRALLERSSRSLEELSINLEYPFTFPPSNAPAMPELQTFYTDTQLNITDFAKFLTAAPKLNSLSLCCNAGDNGDWRELWRAIRYHPSRMTLDFDQIPCNDVAEISMSHFTGDMYTEEEDDPDDPWGNIIYSLANYLSKKKAWNKSCRMWFEDAGSDDDSDSDFDSDGVVNWADGLGEGNGSDGEWEDVD